jgi:hypothetical protein
MDSTCRPLNDREVTALKEKLTEVLTVREILDLCGSDMTERLIARIESDTEWITELQKQNRYLRDILTPDQVIRSLLDRASDEVVRFGDGTGS